MDAKINVLIGGDTRAIIEVPVFLYSKPEVGQSIAAAAPGITSTYVVSLPSRWIDWLLPLSVY